MKFFNCQCGNPVFFRNSHCTQCGRQLGYSADDEAMLSLNSDTGQWETGSSGEPGQPMRPCRNYSKEHVCNWLVKADDPESYCRACRLNEMIPDLSQPNNRNYWYRIECAKRHLLYTLFQLGLQVTDRKQDAVQGLSFVFIKDVNDPAYPDSAREFGDELLGRGRVMTGHLNGRITINIDEADDVKRTRQREIFQEPYRTVLGHFRHEIGHYYWDLLIRDTPLLEEFRRLFGDENLDYAASRKRHYSEGPPADWKTRFISAYASMHPWEDWAESWAHYLHILDTLETAEQAGFIPTRVSAATDFSTMISTWQGLTPGLNALCRSMGVQDLYPFVIHNNAYEKLAFVHRVIREKTN